MPAPRGWPDKDLRHRALHKGSVPVNLRFGASGGTTSGGFVACMSHQCGACGWLDFDNSLGPDVCPKCASENLHHHFDEEDLSTNSSRYFCDEEEI